MKDWTRYPGTLDIFGNHDDDQPMTIRVTDDGSRRLILELEITPLELWKAIRSLGARPIVFRLNAQANEIVGMQAEHKTVLVFVPNTPYRGEDSDRVQHPLIQQVLRYIEVDGWQANTRDLFNHHCYQRGLTAQTIAQECAVAGFPPGTEGNVHLVHMHRLVPKEAP